MEKYITSKKYTGTMRLIVKGTVQGVGFRPAVYRTAVALGLRGFVCNEGSHVTIDVDDGDLFMSRFLADLPPLAKIESIEKIPYEIPPEVDGFTIRESEAGKGEGFSIPTDTAICARCLEDLHEGRRKGYPFTSCTDCGPRFTLLRSLPYDRAGTAMGEFPVCPSCGREYSTPSDRRFHHQTVCCPSCGPQYRLVGKNGETIEGDPITEFAKMLREGNIGIAKSWGGMHICCTLANTARMREWYGRKQKPFAIMVKDLKSARKYCDPTPEEEEQLTSPFRPIVLAEKRNLPFNDIISPGLDNIGIFLPYTGMQVMLFDKLGEDALIMTSANVPGEPMILDDKDIMTLGADMYLLHNQEIINRADDSVIRLHGDRTFFIRKSRGAVPSYISFPVHGNAVAVGAQENLAGAVASDGRIYPTQHIGNGEGIGVPEYLEQAIRFQMSLVGCEPQVVAEDLHPAYLNRRFASELAEEYSADLIDVQHHWAHVASLMADCDGLSRMTALALDGTGHGDDGKAWGGEVLSCDYYSYKRLAHLEYIPLLGGQKALTDLRRLRFAIDEMNGDGNKTSFSESEAEILRKLIPKSVQTSSFGRILDALSFYLGICDVRTYDGEPAMKLEPLLARGRLVEGFETETVNGVIRTAHLFRNLKKCPDPADAAYSVVYNILCEMVDQAAADADTNGEDYIGITGGVSYDTPIVYMTEKIAAKYGKKVLCHNRVPNGDGGISTGQAAIALHRL
ncbi:hydrogenase maturation factor HypF [methanogenic archaeon ISO4-H5]|nr:hydrogenase maturation factor HypF [methanogenic archaeon ISO4-H5]